ncbi:MAG: ABC transporter substrate-binding protein [Arcobacteraceae bacterium]|nr:ABC transporter substrate-binding protein [Arcobacteraceae bacterium]
MIFIKYILFLIIFITTLTANEISKISLQLQWKHQFEFAGFYMAKEKGFYKDVNLDVELKEFNFGTDTIDDVHKGKTTYGLSYPSIILEKSHGKDVVLLNAILQSSPHVLVSLKSSGIKSIKDFKNKRIMINDNAAKTASFTSMLKSKSVSLNDMTKLKHTFHIDDLINGKTDIITCFTSNELYFLDKKGIKYNVWDPKDYGFDFYDLLLFTSNNELKNNPKRVEAFRQASLKGWEYAFSHIDETADLILKKYNTQKKDKEALLYEARILKQLAYTNTKALGNIDKNKIQRIYDIYNLMGLTKDKIDLDKFIYQPSTKTNILTEDEKNYLKNYKIIKMCNNPNWEPIEFAKDGNMNNMSGIAIDTLKVIEEKLNIKFQNVATKSWSESQQFLKDKKCDILPCAIKISQREKYANFTKPYLNLPLAIFTTKDKNVVSGLDEIMDKPWTRQKGSGLIAKLKKEYPNMKIIETKGDKEALQYVNSGKAYFTIATLPVASHVISKFQLNDLQIAGYTGILYNLSMAVRDDDKVLLSILDKGLADITQEQSKQIFKKWVSSSIKEPIVNYKLIRNILIVVFIIILLFIYKQYMLKKSLKDLKIAVENKTKDLQELNENLEIKIKEEVEKNLDIQKQLFKSEKLAAMGEMIGNIAHQWRQPLSIISTGATGIQVHKKFGNLTDKFLDETCTMIDNNAQYLSKTIDDFRNFIKGNREKENFNLKENINSFISLVEGSIKTYDLNLIVNVDEQIEIYGFANELMQCYINIFNNAKDILKDINDEDKFIFISGEIKNDNIVIKIKDNGGGIPEDILVKIFDPYFTTKHKSQGTGLGLHMTYNLITKGMNGAIEAKNVEFQYNGKKYTGAQFEITLPKN